MKTERFSEKRRRCRYLAAYAVLLVLFAVLFMWNINAGSVDISVREICGILFSGSGDEMQSDIICQIRLPRITAAAVLGGALALAGFLLQTFFRNPIAGPFVLGISSGAEMAVAATMVFLLKWGLPSSSWIMILAAFAGALLSMGFVLILSGRIGRSSMLIVCGVMVGYICSAITDFFVTFAEDSDIVNLYNWSMGSFSGKEWGDVAVIACFVLAAFLGTLLLVKPISAFRLGEGYAQSMGMNVRLFRVLLLLLSSLLSACVVAYAGPVSFVGIAVPHLTKRMFSSSKPSLILPGSFLLGAVFCLVCDLIARTVFAPTELAISTVTAVLGAPVVIAMLLSRRRGEV